MATHDKFEVGNLFVETGSDETPAIETIEIAQNNTPTAGGSVQPAGSNTPPETLISLERGTIARLPAGSDIANPKANGSDLEFVQPDGSIIVITNGVVQGLILFIGDIEIPAETVTTLLTANNIETAAGPDGGAPDGAHGNFTDPEQRSIGEENVEFTKLLSDTEIGNGNPENENTDEASEQETLSAAINDAPETNAATATGLEDAASILVALSGSDVDGTVTDFRILSLPTNGALFSDAGLSNQLGLNDTVGATVFFVPNANFNGTPTFTYASIDNLGLEDASPATATITVTAANDAPETNVATATGLEDAASISVALSGGDIDGTVTDFRILSLPTNGALFSDAGLSNQLGLNDTVGATVFFVPDANFNGTPGFTYASIDNLGLEDTSPATATITVTAVNDAPETNAASATGLEDAASISITLSGSDVDGTVTDFRILSLPTNGALFSDAGLSNQLGLNDTVAATGNGATVFFVPDANFNGTRGFTYASIDNLGLEDTSPATATITVTAVNDAPETNAATATGLEDAASISVALSGSDVDGTVTDFRILSLPTNGALFSDAGLSNQLGLNDTVGATVFFVPDANFNGTPGFTYASIDNLGLEDASPATATITVTAVNDAPETNAATATGLEDAASISVALSGSDVDGTVTDFRILSLPTNGALFSDAGLSNQLGLNDTVGATVFFVPDANFNGTPSFTYASIDNLGLEDPSPATATITVTAANDAPTLASLDDVTFLENTVNVTPQIIDADIVFGDIDSVDLDTGTLTVSGFVGSEDTIGINNQGTGAGQISVDGANVRFANIIIGTFTGGSGANDLVVTFNGASTPAAVDALLQNLTYANSSDTPTENRTLTITVTDGDGGMVATNSVVSVTAEADFIDLSDLNISTGLRIVGIDGGDRSGFSVSSAGDINGDGFDDLIIGARLADGGTNNAQEGESYVLFGGASLSILDAADGNTADGVIDLDDIKVATGLRIVGINGGDVSGFSVSSAGDVNGDGFDDLIIGAPLAQDGANNSGEGESYVLFGGASLGLLDAADGNTADGIIDLDDITAATGLRIVGIDGIDISGFSVSSVGDVNGDGFDDLIIGAPRAEVGASNTQEGESYVLFGGASLSVLDAADGNTADGIIDLDDITAATGLRIVGINGSDLSGYSVSSAGDVNGDGFDDLIIGAPFAEDSTGNSGEGESYVLFGGAFLNAVNGVIALGNITAATGLRIAGKDGSDRSGFSVSSAGDVNGDGFDDLIIGAPRAENGASNTQEGESYVLFGGASLSVLDAADGNAADGVIDLDDIKVATGLRIVGSDGGDLSGVSVSSAGDINGDGFDDLIIGAPLAEDSATNAGESYVLFGGAFLSALDAADGNAADGVINLGDITSATGLRIIGIDGDDRSGYSVSTAGDVNGDGFDDLIIGAPFAEDGTSDTGEGESYVLFGGAFGLGNTPVTTNGSGGADVLLGGLGNDVLIGNGGADVIRSGAGDDVLAISDTGFARIDGGTGKDILRVDGAGVNLDLTTILPAVITDIETIDLTGSGNNSLTLSKLDVFDITTEREGGTTILTVTGVAGDTVTFTDAGWTGVNTNGTISVGGVVFNRYINGNAEVRVQVGVTTGIDGDPIVLDLGGDGFEFAGPVNFDLDADGIAETLTSWVGGQDGLLVVDYDGSGQIEDGSEIVSPHLGEGGKFDSLEALRSLDSNKDGLLDGDDLDFDKVMVWQDKNSDGITDEGELSSLGNLGIASIDLAAELADFDIGNTKVLAQGRSGVTLENGETLDFMEVGFSQTSGAEGLEGFLEDPAGDEYDLASLLDNAFGDDGETPEDSAPGNAGHNPNAETFVDNNTLGVAFEVVAPVEDSFS